MAGLSARAGRAWQWFLTVAAGYDVALGLGTLAEYVTGRALGIDHLIGPAYLSTPGVPAGRVAPSAAACWAILGGIETRVQQEALRERAVRGAKDSSGTRRCRPASWTTCSPTARAPCTDRAPTPFG